ncbi:putative periplasmic lipoprotein [Thioflavicoccus mobilis 8321]|uniref:Putative periplasmic lipoprotein n=1 Tax=Thioflavicoccus mobilis 8321 TaxID=765912 RepID=L0GU57_9GAMM|nr:imelysin family protein [Thioflavicoccus mobilis]AGA89496.1 putative periplasmic lipoprotein [Thioflavicoccus mobilis 8321]
MPRRLVRTGLIVLVHALAFSPWAGADDSPSPPSTQAVATAAPTASPESAALRTLADAAVRPALAQLADTSAGLADAVETLCVRPQAEPLTQAREAWRTAYAAWRRAEPFLFGPMKALDLRKRIGVWPTNATVLDAAVTTEDMRDLLAAADARGYAAAEYLLFAPSDAAAAAADGRCAHLRDLTAEIADLTGRTPRIWAQDYERRFVAAGDGGPFLVPGDALSLPFAEALNVTERMLRDRIGYPSGFFEDQARPEHLEAWHSGSSRLGLTASLEGLRMMIGAGEASIAELIATRDGVLSQPDPALAADLVHQIDKALADLARGERPLHEELRDRPKRLKRLYLEVERLQEQLVEATLVLELDVLTR